MALTYGFYNSVADDREYDAIDMGRLFDGIILDGVYAALGEYFLVTENSTPDMNVIVGTGRAWFNHTWSYNDADVVLSVTTADALLPRIDVVYLEINEDTGVRANKLDILDGTPASSPVAPTLTNTTTVHQYPLAHIYVGAAVTSITNANLTNKVGTTECPFVTCPLTYVTTNDLLAQWESEWEQWFNAIKDQLSTEAETNLQAQIWDLAGVESGAPPYATDMVSLSTHDHSGDPGDQIPTAGIENLAITEAKIAAGALTNSKYAGLSITADKIADATIPSSKLSTEVAGTGLTGGNGTPLRINTDDTTIIKSGDLIKVPTGGITPTELEGRYRRIIVPSTVFKTATGSAPTWSHNQDDGNYMNYADAVIASAGASLQYPTDFDGNGNTLVYIIMQALGSGNVYWDLDYTFVKAGRDTSDPKDGNLNGYLAANANTIEYRYLGQFDWGDPNQEIMINFTLTRFGSSGNDTCSSSCWCYGVVFDYPSWF